MKIVLLNERSFETRKAVCANKVDETERERLEKLWLLLDARGADGKAKADGKADGKAYFKADCTDGKADGKNVDGTPTARRRQGRIRRIDG